MDAASQVLVEAALLYARADNETSTNGTSSSSPDTASRPASYKIVGIILAVCSGLFIGTSFVLKKLGLLKANVKYNEEAGEGYGYLKNVWWWTGMTLMIVGELCNFVALAFVTPILVTPFGALSVVVTTVLSAVFLKERLSFVGQVSCFLCVVGAVIIALNAPQQSTIANIQQMQHYVITPGFLSYTGVIILGSLFTAFWAGPRYGKKSMLVYLTICSLIGGLSVVATQGLGAAIVAQINGESQFTHWFLYVLLVFMVCTLLTEIIYLNKALNLFNAAMVTPTYYVYFTSSTIVASAVLSQGFDGTAVEITTVCMGFLVICSGVVLLQLAKSAKDVPDTAIFKSGLDQVRTIAEQEEPEYEPRADTVRGGAAIVRAMSKTRTKRQAEEAHRIHEERMEPIGEDEQVEWDGMRRRKTVSTSSGSIVRRKTIHPPLGMTHFPDDISEPDSEVHPGFFGRIGRKSATSISQKRRTGRSPVPLETVNVDPDKESRTDSRKHVYGLPPGLQKPVDMHDEDTSYASPSGPSGSRHLHWPENDGARDRAPSQSSSLAPPRPPPHGSARRQFSFQNVFHRNRSDTGPSETEGRPLSRGALSFKSVRQQTAAETEEERLGLVTGDSSKQLPPYQEVPEYDEHEGGSDGWQVASGSVGSSPEHLGGDIGRQRRSRDPYDNDDEDDDLYDAPLHSIESRGGR